MDHSARAKELRQRASMCIDIANETTSQGFKGCYKLLAVNYLIQARLEEDFVAANMARSAAPERPLAKLSPRRIADDMREKHRPRMLGGELTTRLKRSASR